tara:strand:+ start:6105 stop:7736 length:1632 start_codon:yes stop_codon:yes gene_type:complete
MNKDFQDHLNQILKELNYDNVNIIIQIPKKVEHGDLSSPVAMTLAKKEGKNPQDIANQIIHLLKTKFSDNYSDAYVAGPGFINVRLNKNILTEQVKEIFKNDYAFGKNNYGKGKNAIVEFVSANPTGPLTVAHGRGAIVGDTISRILEWNGYKVDREYYFNNAGRQMRKLGESVKSRYLTLCKIKTSFPEDGYQGKYINDIAESFKKKFGNKYIEENNIEIFKDFAEKEIFEDIKRTLNILKIKFDNFFNEDDLYKDKSIEKILSDLSEKNLIYDKDNATWFSGTKVNRPVDRVLVKSTGEPTYRLPDMAYHRTKFERNYDKIIDIFGADHMDAYPDVMEVMNQLDYDIKKMEVLIHQFVTITENNKPIKMSTRKANFTTLEELCEEVGSDVVRYFFIMRNINTHLNFELKIAKEQSDANPILYLQYAHARICTIIRKAKDLDLDISNNADLNLLVEPIENDLMNSMINFKNIIIKSYQKLDPQIISNYLEDLAAKFHKYYSKHKVISNETSLSKSRLFLINSLRIVLRNGLNVLGIKEKERM